MNHLERGRGKKPKKENPNSSGPSIGSFIGNLGPVRTFQRGDSLNSFATIIDPQRAERLAVDRSKSGERGAMSVDYAISILENLPFVADIIEADANSEADSILKADLLVYVDRRWVHQYGLPDVIVLQIKTGWTCVDQFILKEQPKLNGLTNIEWQDRNMVMLMAASGKADQSSLIVPLLLQVLNHQNRINLGENVSDLVTLLRENNLWQDLITSLGEVEARAAQTYLENAFGWRWHHILYWVKIGSHLKNEKPQRVGHTRHRY